METTVVTTSHVPICNSVPTVGCEKGGGGGPGVTGAQANLNTLKKFLAGAKNRQISKHINLENFVAGA